MTRRMILFLLGLCLVIGGRASSVMGQSFPGGSGMEVSVFLYADPNPALNQRFVESLEQQALLMLRTMLGSGANVELLRLPNLSKWLQRGELDELDEEQCRGFGCDKTEKAVLLCIRYSRGTFLISGAEFDRHFDSYGPVQSSRIVQRSMVKDAVGRMAMRCWTPIGEINSFKDGAFSIGFANLARLIAVSKWSNLGSGAVLQVYRETLDGNQMRQDAHPTELLVVDSISQTGARAKPIGQSDTAWFQYLGHPQARYLARRVMPRSGKSTVKVMLSGLIRDQPDVLVPRGGCDVYITDQPPSGNRLPVKSDAVTNRGGIAQIEIDSTSPVFITVAYEDYTSTQPIVSGVTPDPIEFRFDYQGNRSDHLVSLNWIRDELRARSATINDLIKTINDTAKQGDAATIRSQADQALASAEAGELVAQANSIQERAKKEGLDISKQVASVLAVAQQLDQSTKELQETLRDAEMFAVKEHQLEEIQNLFNQRDWMKTLAAMEKFAAEFPDHPQTARLPAFRSAVQAKGKEHADARTLLLDSIGLARSDELMKRWDKMRDAIELLLKHDDGLYLASVNAELDSWIGLLNQEINDIKAANVPGLTTDQAKKLQDRANKATQVRTDFDRLRPLVLSTAEKAKNAFNP